MLETDGLTETQIAFIYKYMKVPKLFGKQKARETQELWATEFRVFNTARENIRTRIGTLKDTVLQKQFRGELEEAEEIIRKNTKRPDFEGGMKHLEFVENAVKKQKLSEEVAAEMEFFANIVELVLDEPVSNRDQLLLIWGYAQDRDRKAKAGGDIRALNAVLDTLANLQKALFASQPLETGASGDVIRNAKSKLQDEADRKGPIAVARKAVGDANELIDTININFDGALPPAVDTKLQALKQLLDIDEEGAPGDISSAANAVDLAAEELRRAAKAPLDELNRWLGALELFRNARLGVLKTHRMSSDETFIKPLITAIELRLNTAIGLADTHDYTGACTELDEAGQDCDDATEHADHVAEYLDLLADRGERIATLPDKTAAAGFADPVKTAILDVHKLYDDAKLAFDTQDLGAIAAAQPNLRAIPKAVNDALWLKKQKDSYDQIYAGYAHAIVVQNGYEPAFKAIFTLELDNFRTQIQKAHINQTGDYLKSMSLMNSIWTAERLITAKRTEWQSYNQALVDFDARLQQVRDMDGNPWAAAVQEYKLRLERNRAYAVGLVVPPKRDFAIAQKILEASADVHAEELQKGVLAKSYFEKKDFLETNIPIFPVGVGGTRADEVLNDSRNILADAIVKAGTGDWQAARNLAVAAQEQYNTAFKIHTAIDADRVADRPAVIDNMDADSNAAFDTYDAAVLGVESNDPDNVFRKALDVTRKKFNEAVGAWNKSLSADATRAPGLVAEAKRILKEAVAEVEDMHVKVHRYYAMKAKLLDAGQRHTNYSAPTANLDGVLDPDLRTYKGHIDAAITALKTGNFDFDTAETRLQQADTLFQKLREDQSDYFNVPVDRANMKEALAYMQDPARRDGCTNEITQMTGLIGEVETATAARNFKLAAKKAAEGRALVRACFQIGDNYARYAKARAEEYEPLLKIMPATRTFSAAEDAELNQYLTQMRDFATAHNYAPALINVYRAAAAARRVIDLERDGKTYDDLRRDVEPKLQGLRMNVTPEIPALEAELKTLEDALTEAGKLAAIKNYQPAAQKLKPLSAAANGLAEGFKAFEAFDEARGAARTHLERVERLDTRDQVEAIYQRALGRFGNAETIAVKGDYVAATAMMREVEQDGFDALLTLEATQEYSDFAEDLKGIAAEDADGLETAIRRARSALDTLKDAPEFPYLFGPYSEGEQALKQAETFREQGDGGAAIGAIETVMEKCLEAELQRSEYRQLQKSEAFANKQITGLLSSHTEVGLVREELRDELDRIETAMNDVRADHGKRNQALTVIETAIRVYHTAKEVADAHAEAMWLVSDLRDKIEALEKHPSRYVIVDELKAVKTEMEAGITAANERRHGEAMPRLSAALTRADQALLTAKLYKGEAPSVEELRSVLAQDEGTKKLDAMISKLDATAQRKVMNVAFEARFGCKLTIYDDPDFGKNELETFASTRIPLTKKERREKEKELKDYKKQTPKPDALQIQWKENEIQDLIANGRLPTEEEFSRKNQEIEIRKRSENLDVETDKKAPNIRRFYEMMADLPPASTVDNASLQIFLTFNNRSTTGETSYFNPERKLLAMCEGEAGPAQTYYGIGLPHELEEIDGDSTPVDGESLTFFDWNTLHEVGHAVDDKLGHMKRKGGDVGWVEYGSNVQPVAQAIAGEVRYDEGYIAAYLGNVSKPEIPAMDGTICPNEDEWESRRLRARALVDSIRSGVMPWQTASSAKGSAIGGVCYQESYPNTWTSYPLDLRKKGVSGYMFRAPGEFFAELYAAFHSKRLNPNHPYADWFKDKGI